MPSRLRFVAAGVVLGGILVFSALGVFSASASAKPKGKVVSAKLTPKSSFTAAQAMTVKLVCKFSPASKRVVFALSMKKNAKWVKVRSVAKKGSIKIYTTTVKKLFGSKAVKAGQYRIKISADVNSLTRKLTVTTVTTVTEPPSSDESGDEGSGSTGSGDEGSGSTGAGDCGADCDDDPGADDGSLAPVAPGGFSKTSPSNGATGLSPSLTLSWSVSSNADDYQYCVDKGNNTYCDNPASGVFSTGWVTASSTAAAVSGLPAGTY